jgi:peptide deformylase
MVMEIKKYGDSVLREKSLPVSEITPEIQKIIDEMIGIMYRAPGVGLAAPQIGISQRIIVADPSEGKEIGRLLVLINPAIVSAEGEIVAEEGCLSVPDVTAEVKRSSRVIVEGLNRQGRKVQIEGENHLARILQHEIDHLEGVLFIDRLGFFERQMLLRKWRKRHRKSHARK